MNKIYFEGLDLKIQSPHVSFRDDGIVGNMLDHYHYILTDFRSRNANEIMYCSEPTKHTSGKYLYAIFPNNTVETVIFQEDLGCNKKNLVVRAHEETHVLHDMGFLNLLSKELKKEGILIPGFMKHEDPDFSDAEYVANIGGLFALYKKHSSSITAPESHHIYKALQDFEKAKKSFFRPLIKTFFSNYYL